MAGMRGHRHSPVAAQCAVKPESEKANLAELEGFLKSRGPLHRCAVLSS